MYQILILFKFKLKLLFLIKVEETRVKLTPINGIEDSHYINANYISVIFFYFEKIEPKIILKKYLKRVKFLGVKNYILLHKDHFLIHVMIFGEWFYFFFKKKSIIFIILKIDMGTKFKSSSYVGK